MVAAANKEDSTLVAGGAEGGVSPSIAAKASTFSSDAFGEVIMYLQAILLNTKLHSKIM